MAAVLSPLFRTPFLRDPTRLLPIVMTIPGLFDITHMIALRTELSVTQRYSVQHYSFPGRTEDLAGNSRDLLHFLKELKSRRSEIDVPVHFVTYSYGGLVLREALRHIDWRFPGSKVVMIAPPNQGSMFVRKLYETVPGTLGVGLGELGKLRPSDCEQRFGPLPATLETLIVAGTSGYNPWITQHPHDGIVSVEETLLYGSSHNTQQGGHARRRVPELVTVPAWHSLLPFHPTVLQTTLSFLDKD